MLEIALPFTRPSREAWRRGTARSHDLMRLAREVEPAQPAHAVELRGIALHEAAAAAVPAPAAGESWWRSAGRRAWKALEAHGEARAQRELMRLAECCEATQPELAKELRAACARAA